MPQQPLSPLTTTNHDRDRAGLRYVYPVVSRRAGGVSIGINLNPNNACNWACIYCQVPDLTRGGPPPLDLPLLERELRQMLDAIQEGDFMQREVPEGARHLMDIAFSGNGEPTTAPEFSAAMQAVIDLHHARGLVQVKLRLITNGSQMSRADVQHGVGLLGRAGGEVWFKLDAVTPARVLAINGVSQGRELVLRRLRQSVALCTTWVQTCMFMLDGSLPDETELLAYLEVLGEVREEIAGVLLYGLARPSMQPDAARLQPAPAEWLEAVAARIAALGLTVRVSP